MLLSESNDPKNVLSKSVKIFLNFWTVYDKIRTTFYFLLKAISMEWQCVCAMFVIDLNLVMSICVVLNLLYMKKNIFDVYLYLHPLMAILKPRQDHVFYHHSFKFSFMSFILIWNKMIWLITHWLTHSLTLMLAEMLTAFPELVLTCLFRSGQVRSRQVR